MTDKTKKYELPDQKALEIGTRLKKPPSGELVRSAFADELNQQGHLFEAIGLVDIAHTLAAIQCGTIPQVQGRCLLVELLALQTQSDSFTLLPELGDIYTNREAWLAERTESVGWLGAGRARREAITSAFMLVLRALLVELMGALIALGSTLVDKAEQYLLAIMPDYTYLQAAQPTTFGHYLLGFAFPLLRDLDRLQAFFSRLNHSPMGCGSSNGSRLRQDRQLLADFLGFDGIIPHARDAMWQADIAMEAVSILTASSINLSRLSEDLQVYATQEFALVELDDRHARASKIMPQKKNPFALTHIRGIANRMIGVQASVYASERTPTGQPDNRSYIYGELPEATQTLAKAVSLLTEVLADLVFNVERGKVLVASGWILSTDLAESLVLECGLDFRKAHQLVACLASEHQNKPLLDLGATTVIQAAEKLFGHPIALSSPQLSSMLDANLAIQARSEPGGASGTSMDNMIAECRQQLARHQENNRSRQQKLVLKQQSLFEHAMKETCQK